MAGRIRRPGPIIFGSDRIAIDRDARHYAERIQDRDGCVSPLGRSVERIPMFASVTHVNAWHRVVGANSAAKGFPSATDTDVRIPMHFSLGCHAQLRQGHGLGAGFTPGAMGADCRHSAVSVDLACEDALPSETHDCQYQANALRHLRTQHRLQMARAASWPPLTSRFMVASRS